MYTMLDDVVWSCLDRERRYPGGCDSRNVRGRLVGLCFVLSGFFFHRMDLLGLEWRRCGSAVSTRVKGGRRGVFDPGGRIAGS
jgi:hypothetical protein